MENQYCEISNDELTTSYIEYKELKVDDFANFEVRRDFLDIGNKYLSEIANDYIDLNESNTVVINSSVGQGKSIYAVDIARNYYLQKNEAGNYMYTIIFAVPYKTLVEQYIEKITKKISETGNEVNIPDYAKLVPGNEDNFNQINDVRNAITSRMHVITVNCLLANPGEDAIEQSFVKRDYLKGIIKRCINKKRKVIIIFDEIHDAIHNFKQEFIFYLWRFKTNKILHKTFILSATFNEASKVVIKYIAELTEKKLQIIETSRIQQKDNLSNLHIHLTKNSLYGGYNFDTPEFVDLFSKIINRHQNLNILSFSQTLCNKIASGENGKDIREALLSKYRNINICIAEENHPSKSERRNIPSAIRYSNKYIPGMCNIGTTFKTGISIEEENTGFVIILPSANSMQGYVKSGDYGVFTNGTIPLIQALARVRKKSDVYVIMPFPKQYIRETLSLFFDSSEYTWNMLKCDIFKDKFFMHSDWKYVHHLYPDQYRHISTKYNAIRERIKKEIEEIESIEEERKQNLLPYLKYPSLEMFILEKGEQYLYSTFAIFGKDLPSYMIWAAYNNQFINCKLKSLSSTNTKKREEVEFVLEFLYNYYMKNYNTDIVATYDYAMYYNLYQRITSDFELYVKNRNFKEWVSLSDNYLKRYIMAFVQASLKGNNRLHELYYQKDDSGHIIDKLFEASDYILCNVANAMCYNENEIIDVYTNDSVIKAYKDLFKIRQIFIDKLVMQNNNRKYIHPKFEKYTNSPLDNTEIDLIIQTIRTIDEQDIHFKCFRKFQKIDYNATDKALNSIYSELREVFFNLKKEQKLPVSRINVDFVNEIIELPAKRTGLNLLYKYQYTVEENYDDDILAEIMYDESISAIPLEEWEESIIEEDNLNEGAKQLLKEYRENRNISDNQ